jgi:uncharacterized SAM-binding protein YcdF (DUF218 family)
MGLKLKHRRHRFSCLAVSGLILIMVSIIPSRSAIAYFFAPQPQAIFTLGGDLSREIFTAQFAQRHPNLEIWISSGSPDDGTSWAFGIARISPTRLHIDRRAVDTVTNFTSLVADFKSRHFHHLYLITADYHMRRAKAIATFVFGSQGIAFTPVSIPTDKPTESWLRTLRDIFRALLWIFTRHTGVSLNQ